MPLYSNKPNNMLSTNDINTLNALNWTQVKSKPNHIIFQKKGRQTDVIEIEIFDKYIAVTVPIQLGNVQYRTKFNSGTDAVNYVIMHMQEKY